MREHSEQHAGQSERGQPGDPRRGRRHREIRSHRGVLDNNRAEVVSMDTGAGGARRLDSNTLRRLGRTPPRTAVMPGEWFPIDGRDHLA